MSWRGHGTLALALPMGLLHAGCTHSAAQPNYAVAPQPAGRTCSANPAITEELLRAGQRLGVQVIAGQQELPGKDGRYRAEDGRLGTIRLKQRLMSAKVSCLLISHEFIHVLQHLHGQRQPVSAGGPWNPCTKEQLVCTA
jgi:hypothetical protein